MKWPASVMLIRHDTSAYNVLKGTKKDDALYQRFLEAEKKDPSSVLARKLAQQVQKKFALPKVSGYVVDPLGDVVNNVDIKIQGRTSVLQNNEHGDFNLFLEQGNYTITFAKEGYKSTTLNLVQPIETTTVKKITLIPEHLTLPYILKAIIYSVKK